MPHVLGLTAYLPFEWTFVRNGAFSLAGMVGTELIVPRLVSTIDRCPYVEEIWKHLLNTLLARGSPLPLQDEAEWVMNHYPGHGLISSIAKLAFSATIYHTWKERNARIFKQSYKAARELFYQICAEIKGRISASKLKYSNSTRDQQILALASRGSFPFLLP